VGKGAIPQPNAAAGTPQRRAHAKQLEHKNTWAKSRSGRAHWQSTAGDFAHPTVARNPA
jgi:hypothetical protein